MKLRVRFNLSTLFVIIAVATVVSEAARALNSQSESPFLAAFGLFCYAALSTMLVTSFIFTLVNRSAATVTALLASAVWIVGVGIGVSNFKVVLLFAGALLAIVVMLLVGIWKETGKAPTEMHSRLLKVKNSLQISPSRNLVVSDSQPAPRQFARRLLTLAFIMLLVCGAYYGAYLMLCEPVMGVDGQTMEPEYLYGGLAASYAFYPAHLVERDFIWPARWHEQ